MVVFTQPIALILLVPLGAALVAWGHRSRWLFGLRALAWTLVVLALAGFTWRLPRQHGTVVVVVDRSKSMPDGAEASQREAIDRLQDARSADEHLKVVGFGRAAASEHVPDQGKFPGFVAEVGGDASNLAEAMELGLGLIPKGAPGRMLVLSDGQWTGRDPALVGVQASERNVAIDHRALTRASEADVAVARVEAPSSVRPGESFLITAWVRATSAQEIAFELRRGDAVLNAGRRKVEPGLTRLTFRDQAGEPGTQGYAVSVSAKEGDAILENNTAKLLVGVSGAKPVLVVPSSPKSSFPGLLRAGGIDVKTVPAEQTKWTLEALSNYSGVVLENVPAERLGHAGMETLAAWVQQTGAGLMLTGGRASYGQGGYYKSPLDPLLPVSMELRQEHRKLSLAIVVALDRSGSMAMPVGGGRVKMDLANLGAAQVVDLLGPSDEFGCIAVDSAPHTIHDLGLVKNKAAARDKILRINSEGGGIFVYEALEASYAMLAKAKAGTKHVILFSDAADAEEPKAYVDLMKKMRADNITVSVIGLGKETDKDGELLKDIAKRGSGRHFFTDTPDELPRLFAQDTFVVARNSFLDEPTPFATVAGLATLTSKTYMPPALGGYNLCYLRPTANLAAVTRDEYKAPVVAAWQSGAGRVLCYTGEADGKYTGAMAKWKDVGDFHATCVRWIQGRGATIPGVVVAQERAKGVAQIRVHLDPDRTQDPFATLPEAALLRAQGSRAPTAERVKLRWLGPDTLGVDAGLHGGETLLAAVDLPGHGPLTLPPTCLPYSPEYEPPADRVAESGKPGETERAPERWGVASLQHLSKLTGGRERVDLSETWREMPRRPRLVSLAPWLLSGAVVVFLMEVLERLTGLVSRGLPRRARPATTVDAPASAPRSVLPAKRTRVAAPAPLTDAPVATPGPPPPPTPAPPAGQPGLLDALRKVQDRKRPGK